MRVVIFCHSLISDWNHGNAHFLRGVCSELVARGHDVRVFEPRDAWSVQNLIGERGEGALDSYKTAYPMLDSIRYESLDLEEALDGADLVLVHEWNEPSLVERIGEERKRRSDFLLLFHDTHHRSVTDPEAMSRYKLDHYDGVLAFGESVAEVYRKQGWARRVWAWHEAADTRVCRPMDRVAPEGDLVWIGNWGDDERTAELKEFLIDPVRDLKLRAVIHGVRYPDNAKQQLANAGIEYRGWVPNFEAPQTFARFRVTVHVPRRPYAAALPGVPTIRVFEALACGIPLISAPWEDSEGLFREGDFLKVRTGEEMKQQLQRVLRDRELANELAKCGRETILKRHTCAHRVDELLGVVEELQTCV